jgi:hypothetical protein
MRIWTLHPKYLDARGLVALWREGLLAQAVLQGMTIGYVNHPQLARFRSQSSPAGSIAAYLCAVHDESLARDYRFAAGKIGRPRDAILIAVTRGQVKYEWQHLMGKLKVRDPLRAAQFAQIKRPDVHPLFKVIAGGVEQWEKVAESADRKRS